MNASEQIIGGEEDEDAAARDRHRLEDVLLQCFPVARRCRFRHLLRYGDKDLVGVVKRRRQLQLGQALFWEQGKAGAPFEIVKLPPNS